MNQSAEESLMALLEAMLTLAAGTEARRQPPKPAVNPGGFSEEQFVDLTEDERDELSCSICYQILKECMQCANHHKFCHSCLVVWSTTGEYANRVKCPVCRTRGYYFRNDDIDTKVGNKRIKCHMDSCSWTGQVKYLPSHRHDTYGEDTPSDNDSNKQSGSSVPRLEQIEPRVPLASTGRFVGTGLTTRGTSTTSTITDRVNNNQSETASTPRVSLVPGRAASRASGANSVVSSTSQETIIDIGRARGRRAPTNTGVSSLQNSRRPVPPVRAAGTNRITFAHSRPNPNANHTTADGGASSGSSLLQRASISNTINDSTEGIPNSLTGGFTPRPPSAPRTSTNSVNARRLPRIINPLSQTTLAANNPSRVQPQISDSLAVSAANTLSDDSTPSSVETGGTNLGNIRNHLQDSRNRLNNLMSSFSSELDRNRLEMMQFQQERETQRREQLEEVRQLSQRLGQVAFELRRLLEHRRRMPSFSDSESDDDE